MPVKNGQEIVVELKQQPHPYTKEKLKQLILKLYPNSDFIQQNLNNIAKIALTSLRTHKKQQ